MSKSKKSLGEIRIIVNKDEISVYVLSEGYAIYHQTTRNNDGGITGCSGLSPLTPLEVKLSKAAIKCTESLKPLLKKYKLTGTGPTGLQG